MNLSLVSHCGLRKDMISCEREMILILQMLLSILVLGKIWFLLSVIGLKYAK